MIIIPPITITDAMFHDCNINEPSATEETDANYVGEWSSATTYSINQKVIVVANTHKIYQSLKNNNLNVDPTTSGNETWWLELTATDRWKPFDGVVGSQASHGTLITYEIDPGSAIDSVALLNIEATEISVTMTDVGGVGEPVVWERDTIVGGYLVPDVVKTDFPLTYLHPHLVIVITYTGGTAKIGEIVLGVNQSVGTTQYTPSIGITDYSVKAVDDFGNYTILQRAYSKKLSCATQIKNTELDAIYRLLATYRAQAVVWVGHVDYASMIVYGFWKDFNIEIPYPLYSACSLEIEGLV